VDPKRAGNFTWSAVVEENVHQRECASFKGGAALAGIGGGSRLRAANSSTD